MKKNNLKRFLASLLAVLMRASATGMSPAVFAEGEDILPLTEGGEVVQPELKESETPIEVLIKDNFSDEQVKEALANALLTNAEQVDVQSLEWTYTCEGSGQYYYFQTTKTDKKTAKNTATGSIFGFSSIKANVEVIKGLYRCKLQPFCSQG